MKYGALLSHTNEPHGRDVIGPGSNHTHTLWCGSGDRNWFGRLVCPFQCCTDPTILLPFLFSPSGNLLFNRWNGSSCIYTHTRIACPVTILFFCFVFVFCPFLRQRRRCGSHAWPYFFSLLLAHFLHVTFSFTNFSPPVIFVFSQGYSYSFPSWRCRIDDLS